MDSGWVRDLDITFPAELGATAMDGALDRLCDRAAFGSRGRQIVGSCDDQRRRPDCNNRLALAGQVNGRLSEAFFHLAKKLESHLN
mgnify:CR=1 FL=1